MWVADMDFRSAEPIIQALQMRMGHGVFGYSRPSEMLGRALQDRMHRLYGWAISDRDIIFIPELLQDSTSLFRRLLRRVKLLSLSLRFIFTSCAILCVTEGSFWTRPWSQMEIGTKSTSTDSNEPSPRSRESLCCAIRTIPSGARLRRGS